MIYSIGDRVRVTGIGAKKEIYNKIIGYTGTIVSNRYACSNSYAVNIDGVRNPDSTPGYFYLKEEHFELINKPKDINNATTYKVGDIVRFNTADVLSGLGLSDTNVNTLYNTLGVITEIDDLVDFNEFKVTTLNTPPIKDIKRICGKPDKLFVNPYNSIRNKNDLSNILNINYPFVLLLSCTPLSPDELYNKLYTLYHLLPHNKPLTRIIGLVSRGECEEWVKRNSSNSNICLIIDKYEEQNCLKCISLDKYTTYNLVSLPLYRIEDIISASNGSFKDIDKSNNNKFNIIINNKEEYNNMDKAFTVTIENGVRYVTHGKHNGEEIPTITTSVKLRNGTIGKATCDKCNYNEREGIINAIANANAYGNFDREYNRYVKAKKLEDIKERTCPRCGTIYNTIEERASCEKAHEDRKIAKREAYRVRKEARNRIAMAEFENKVEEVMKSIYEKAKENVKASEVEDITDAEATVVSDVVTETTATTVEDITTESNNNTYTDIVE